MTIRRFSIRALFIAVTFIACLCSVVTYVTYAGRKRAAALYQLEGKLSSSGVDGYAIPAERSHQWDSIVEAVSPFSYSPPIARIAFAYDARLSPADIQLLASFPELEELRFNNTNLNDDLLARLDNCHNLRRLSMAGTSVTDAVARHLVLRCNNIVEADLYGCDVGDLMLSELLRLRTIRRIDLRYTNVSGKAIKCPNSPIEELELEGTQASDELIASLQTCANLRNLNLSGCPVTNRSIAVLSKMKNLSWVDLSGTDISHDDVRMLQTALPNCSVRKSD
jgi:Leucine-rich repeat (LRR) protein